MTALQVVGGVYGVLFLAAAVGKLDSWRAWRHAVAGFVGRGRRRTAVVAFGIPLAETAAGVLALVEPGLGLAVCAVLLLLFALGVALLSTRHAGQDCRCFGALVPSEIGPRLIVRDVILGAGAGAAAYLSLGAEVQSLAAEQILLVALSGVLALSAAECVRMLRLSRGIDPKGSRHG
jgi:hypothetical protein